LIVSFIAEVVTRAAVGTERTARTGIVTGFGFISAGLSTVVSKHFTAKHAIASCCMTIIHANKCFIFKSFFAIELTFVGFVGPRVWCYFKSFFIFNTRASVNAVVVAGAVGKAIFMLSKTFVHLIVVSV